MQRLLRTLVVLGSVVIPMACNDPGNPLPGVDVSLSVSSSIIRGNETITVTTTFQNIGWREAFVPSKSCGPLFSVISQRMVSRWSFGQDLARSSCRHRFGSDRASALSLPALGMAATDTALGHRVTIVSRFERSGGMLSSSVYCSDRAPA